MTSRWLAVLAFLLLAFSGLACGSSATPTPAQTAPTLAISTTYPEVMIVKLTTLSQAVGALGELLQNPSPGNDAWRIKVATNMAVIRMTHQEIADLDAPSELRAVHTMIVDATNDCSKSTEYLASGLDHLDTTALDQASKLMISCGTKLTSATKQLSAAKTTTTTSPPGQTTKSAIVKTAANLRSGPGTNYNIVGTAAVSQTLEIVARNAAGDWYQLRGGAWIFGDLITSAPVVPVATVIPPPP